jgi:hypothetical protein
MGVSYEDEDTCVVCHMRKRGGEGMRVCVI